ncbi:MAG: TSUP family transporter, partial [Pirellulales bacterium]
MFELPVSSWLLLLLGGFTVGMSKSGLAGVSLVQVLAFAVVFGARQSTGVLLPLLIVGDCCAVWLVGRDVVWRYVARLLPPALAGVVVGWLLLGRLDESAFKPVIGGLVLALCGGQV